MLPVGRLVYPAKNGGDGERPGAKRKNRHAPLGMKGAGEGGEWGCALLGVRYRHEQDTGIFSG